MLKIVLAAALILVSGCASIIGDEPGYEPEEQASTTQDSQNMGDEAQSNADLKAQADALRESIRARQQELDELNQ